MGLDWDDVEELAEDMVEAGLNPDATARIIGKVADRAFPAGAVVPIGGLVLERFDDKLFAALAAGLGVAGKRAVQAIKSLLVADPDTRARRRKERRRRRKHR